LAEKHYEKLKIINQIEDYHEWDGVGTENNEPYTRYYGGHGFLLMLRKIKINVDIDPYWGAGL
jgi:hypothetical protein